MSVVSCVLLLRPRLRPAFRLPPASSSSSPRPPRPTATCDPEHSLPDLNQSHGIFSGISSDILSDISFDILSGISSDILSGISFDIFSGILSGISSDILSDVFSDILPVGVRQCPLRSGSRG